MERVLECELMLDAEQARAYADADFTEPNSRFVALLRDRLIDLPRRGRALDLGCGPADVTLRLARLLPDWTLDGVDGSDAMLAFAHEAVRRTGLASRVRLQLGVLPDAPLCGSGYDLVLSNSVLHHLRDPADLWRSVRAALVLGRIP